jgi:hypothetical protein
MTPRRSPTDTRRNYKLTPDQRALVDNIAMALPKSRHIRFADYVDSMCRPVIDLDDARVEHAARVAFERYRMGSTL